MAVRVIGHMRRSSAGTGAAAVKRGDLGLLDRVRGRQEQQAAGEGGGLGVGAEVVEPGIGERAGLGAGGAARRISGPSVSWRRSSWMSWVRMPRGEPGSSTSSRVTTLTAAATLPQVTVRAAS